MANEFYWLIERTDQPGAVAIYLGPSAILRGDWTSDPHRAVRFARKDDAEFVIRHLVDPSLPCAAREHGFTMGGE